MQRRSFFGQLFLSISVVVLAAVFFALFFPLWLALSIVLFISLLLSFWIYQRISSSCKEIQQGIERFSRGGLGIRIPLSGPREISNLVVGLNQMARNLNETIDHLTQRRNELESLLSSMTEAVVAVDKEERILTMNRAAVRLFEVDPFWVEGKMLQEQIRNTEFLKFVQKTLAQTGVAEEEIPIYHNQGKRILQAHGTRLRNAREEEIGALMVLNDVTRIRRLENLRREFVANVSHELRTPVTSIKGFLETLQEGAIDNPQEAKEFLTIIVKQAERLHALIEDILQLSKIEQETEMEQIELSKSRLRPILQEVFEVCRSQAWKRRMKIEWDCPEELEISAHVPLLERAVINLVDNAIKYSKEATAVQLQVEVSPTEVLIHVMDHGKGIPEEHLPRIFERFYCVDPSRSRELGGTGLGLAIVKHIMQAHGGSVTVTSQVGEGSIFTLHLPRF